MISAAWDWYYGSQDEELLADCEFGKPYSTKRSSNKEICIRPATLNTGLQVTIFTRVKARPKEETELEKSSKRLKVLRHPNILRHIGIVITETEVHLVTERVSPLYTQFETIDANEVSSGIYDIAQALSFLHDKAGLTHNSVSLESIYVTEGGAWKLSNFENACSFEEATAPVLKDIKRMVEIIPPEENDNMVAFPVENKYGHCRDVYALGILLGLFNKQTRFASEVQTQEVEDLLEEILQKDYRCRPKVKELLETAVLSSDYIEIVNFLQSVTLKSKLDKKNFFTNLIPRLKKACISQELIAKRIAKLLLSPVILAENEAVEKIFPRLLTPIPIRSNSPSLGLISSSMFARYVIPQIVDLLEIKILHVRLVLVSNFHRYVHMFEKSVLQETVLPEILLGLHDSNNQLVKASLHALADSVPIVGGDLIVGAEREKIFGFGMPKFNGTVLVDTSALAYEMKPKRKPIKPKKKSPQRPVTLLELAMKRKKSPSKGIQAQRDLMMLKQNELAMTFAESNTNGHAAHNGKDVIEVVSPSVKPSISSPLYKPRNHEVNMVVKHADPQTYKTSNDVLPSRETREPEMETWADSGSEEETWADFDNFDGANGDYNNQKKLPDRKKNPAAGDPTNKIGRNLNMHSSTSKENKESPELKSQSPRKGKRQSDVRSPTESNSGNTLGTEFEISVNSIPSEINSEPDFFADMAPDIQTRQVPVLPSPQRISRTKKRADSSTTDSTTTSIKSSPISMTFAAADLADDDTTDGWENDTIAWDD